MSEKLSLPENRQLAQLKSTQEAESHESAANTLQPPPFQLKASGAGEEDENASQLKAEQSAFQLKGENEEEEKTSQLKANQEPFQLKASGGGSDGGLPENVQAKMENAFQTDFSGVNIHKDSQSASDVNALAYTQGNDVHFAPGQFKPESPSGQELIGHELTHVVQQRQGKVQPTTESKGMPVNDDPGLEAEADTLGRKAAQAKFAGSGPSGAPQQTGSTTIQKSGDDAERATQRTLNAAARCVKLFEAMDGAGTDEDAIYVVLRPLGRTQVKETKRAYKAMYGKNLVAHLRDELTDGEMTTALRLMLYWPYATGPLGSHQLGLAREKMLELPDYSLGNFTDMVDMMTNSTQRAYLHKALAAGRGLLEIIPFAYRIKGKDDEWLTNHLRLTASTVMRSPNAQSTSTGDIPAGIQQQWNTSCVPTTQMTIRGELDPIYALQEHDANPNMYTMHANPANGLANNPAEAREQRTILQGGGGTATPRSGGGAGMNTSTIGEDEVGIDYDYLQVISGANTPAEALTQVNSTLDAGIPCPMAITNNGNNGGHAVTIISRSGNTYQIHDPWDGGVIEVTRTQLVNSTFNIAGWNAIRYVGVLDD